MDEVAHIAGYALADGTCVGSLGFAYCFNSSIPEVMAASSEGCCWLVGFSVAAESWAPLEENPLMLVTIGAFHE